MQNIRQKILFIIDELELKYFEFNDLVTNHWLIKEFLDRDYKVSISTKNRLMIEDSTAKVICFDSFVKNNDIFYEKEQYKCEINDFDVVFFRPDPPVDINYITACYIFDYVDKDKTLVINDPNAVRNFNEKLHLNYFPEFAPTNIVTSSKEEILSFVHEHETAIIKPLNRCFGSGIYFLQSSDKNLNSIISNVTEGEKTMVMVQEYLDKAVFGDKRVLMLSEHVFDDCVKKLPGKDDFKFNTHSDDFFQKTELTSKEKSMASVVAQRLSKMGLYMVGLDIIDEKIIEINVTSPCFFIREINRCNKTSFQDDLMGQLINFINYKTAKFYAKTNS